MVLHTFTVSRCLAKAGTSIKSPRPQIARSASTYWHVTVHVIFGSNLVTAVAAIAHIPLLLYYSFITAHRSFKAGD